MGGKIEIGSREQNREAGFGSTRKSVLELKT